MLCNKMLYFYFSIHLEGGGANLQSRPISSAERKNDLQEQPNPRESQRAMLSVTRRSQLHWLAGAGAVSGVHWSFHSCNIIVVY